jgi:hypothetical protein
VVKTRPAVGWRLPFSWQGGGETGSKALVGSAGARVVHNARVKQDEN